jgi:hypothetical protein
MSQLSIITPDILLAVCTATFAGSGLATAAKP